MRNFRMEKLAGFMKLAEDGKLTIANDTAFVVTLNQSGIPKDTVLKPGSTVLLGSTNNIDISWEDETQSRSVTVDQAKLNSFLQKGKETQVNLSQLSDEFEPKSAAPQSAGASPAKPKAKGPPAKPLIISYAVGTKLKDNDYTYKVENPSSEFTWIQEGGKSGAFKLSAVGVTKWNQAVTRLNDSKLTTVIPGPPAPTTAPATAATTAPPAAAAAASNAQAESFNPTLVANVATILLNASTRAYASLIPGNQKQQLTSMFEAINTAAVAKLGSGASNPSMFLAKLIIGSVGPEALAGIGKIQNIGSLNERQIKRGAGQEVTRLMEAVNRTYNSYGGDEPKKMSAAFSSVMKRLEAPAVTPPAPVATPAPAASADDGHSKGASLNKKFIKAATLRRLKIRSQMEAAIDSSAQMGRARVY